MCSQESAIPNHNKLLKLSTWSVLTHLRLHVLVSFVPSSELPQSFLQRSAVCKINIDSDSRLAMTGAIREVLTKNPKEFDPRKYLGPARYNHTSSAILNFVGLFWETCLEFAELNSNSV